MLDSAQEDQSRSVIYGIDGDEELQRLVQELADSLHVEIRYCDTIAEMLDRHDWSRPACVVTNICQLSLDPPLRNVLEEERGVCPVVVLSGHHVRLAFEALTKDGLRWLSRPYEPEKLRHAVRKALEIDSDQRERNAQKREIQSRLKTLTDDERFVLQLTLEGKLNKEIASAMDVSKRTVENRRASINQKMEVDSLAELVLKVSHAGDAAFGLKQRHEVDQAVPAPKLALKKSSQRAR